MHRDDDREDAVKRAAGYIRVSTVEQSLHGYSLSAQENLLRQYAAEHDMELVRIYADEGKSASRSLEKRTELLRLLDDAEKGLFSVVVFKDLTRWTRNAAAYYKVEERLEKAGAGWIAVEQPYLETVTPTGRFQVQIMLGTAQLEAEQTGQRIKFIQDAEVKRGHYPFPPHNAPTGYTTKKREDGNYLIIDEQAAPVIRTIFETFRLSNNLQRCVEAVREQYGIEYSHTTINRILRNPVYKGEFRGIQGFCHPIVEPSVFDALQRPKRVYNGSKHKGEYIFSSLTKCAVCGRTMRANCTDDKYHQYNCKSGCGVNITQKDLEKKVLDQIVPAFADYKVIVKRQQRDNKAISSSRAKLMQKKNRLTELFVDGLIDRAEFDRRRTEIEYSLTALEPVQDLPYIKTNFKEMYGKLSPDKKAVFWRAFIKDITVDRDRNISISFHTAKVLAERMGTIKDIE